MTTLAANSDRTIVVGERGGYPVIASDIIYAGAAVGLVTATGHARPLAAGDRFGGFAVEKADNSSGSAADINVRVIKKGAVVLSVTGAVITDVGQPVYATDDDTFAFVGTSAVFVGYISRFVSAGVAEVEFEVGQPDPYAGYTHETLSDNKTLDAQDVGKAFWVTVDAKTVSLPATATAGDYVIINGGAYGTVAVNISPVTADLIMGPDIAGTVNKDLINTKATANRGDLCELYSGHADGYIVRRLVGTWAEEG